MKIKTVLVSQPKPEGDKHPFFDLAKKYNLKIDFRSFIQVEPLPSKEVRKTKLYDLDYTAVIMNSRNAVDNFFKACQELKVEMPAEMKYFCINESMAYYLQKYIQLRKRKVFFGNGTTKDLLNVIKAHKEETFIFPCSDTRTNEIPDFLKKNKIKFREAMLYRTVSSDLTDLTDIWYDMIVFFSPSDVKSLFDNFPKFKQKDKLLAAFGTTTQTAVKDAKLKLDIAAPTPETPSMVMAIDKYIVANKEKLK